MKKRKSNKKGMKIFLIIMSMLILSIIAVKFVIPQIILEEEVAKQVKMAKRDDFYIKKELLLSENLTAEALLVICEDAEEYFNLKSEMVQKWFIHAIDNTQLTRMQEIKLAQIQEIQPILLMTSSYTAEQLVIIAENMNPDLNSPKYSDLWHNAVNNRQFTSIQQEKINESMVVKELEKE